jgi:hypothetical protein
VISQLDRQFAAEVENIITSPLQNDPYTNLKIELVNRPFPTRERRIHQFFTLEMDDLMQSQFPKHLRSLVPDVPDTFLCSIWFSRLPHNVQGVLAFQPEGELDAAARCANRITEAAPMPTLANFAPPTDSTALLQRIDDPTTWQNSALRGTASALGITATDPSAAAQTTRPTPETIPSSLTAGTTVPKSVLSPAPCVFPHKLIPQRKERVNFDIRGANDTTILTHGWLTLRLSLGFRRDFTWRLVVADITQSVIGADFLSHFGCQNCQTVKTTV